MHMAPQNNVRRTRRYEYEDKMFKNWYEIIYVLHDFLFEAPQASTITVFIEGFTLFFSVDFCIYLYRV